MGEPRNAITRRRGRWAWTSSWRGGGGGGGGGGAGGGRSEAGGVRRGMPRPSEWKTLIAPHYIRHRRIQSSEVRIQNSKRPLTLPSPPSTGARGEEWII